MAKVMFQVVVIRKNRETDYFDFYKRGIRVNTSGEELRTDVLSFTELIEAKNKQDAIRMVQDKHLGFVIDSEATMRLG